MQIKEQAPSFTLREMVARLEKLEGHNDSTNYVILAFVETEPGSNRLAPVLTCIRDGLEHKDIIRGLENAVKKLNATEPEVMQ